VAAGEELVGPAGGIDATDDGRVKVAEMGDGAVMLGAVATGAAAVLVTASGIAAVTVGLARLLQWVLTGVDTKLEEMTREP
jgi:hypothetical protein